MRKLELIQPVSNIEMAERRQKRLPDILKLKEDAMEQAPEGRIRATSKEEPAQFYQVTGNGDTTGRYIKKTDDELIRQLAQKTYDKKVLKVLKKERKLLDPLLKHLEEDPIRQVYENLSPSIRQYVTPVTLPDEWYAAEWLDEQYEGNPFYKTKAELMTDRGECVRSKSEVIIANKLFHAGVPYHYEYPVKVWDRGHRNSGTFYPDFYCLNLRTREEFYWEHFGRMSDKEYEHKTAEKLNVYAANNLLLGRDIIATFEDNDTPLDTKLVDQLIEAFLK